MLAAGFHGADQLGRTGGLILFNRHAPQTAIGHEIESISLPEETLWAVLEPGDKLNRAVGLAVAFGVNQSADVARPGNDYATARIDGETVDIVCELCVRVFSYFKATRDAQAEEFTTKARRAQRTENKAEQDRADKITHLFGLLFFFVFFVPLL
jgi:hypothetical protein